MADPLLEIADELYGLPLSDFTAARDARAKELKGEDLGARVKALRKPSLAAWVVDLLVRRDADQVGQVLAVGESLREAAANLDGAELRALTKQRRQLTAAVTDSARALAAEEDVKVTRAVAEQVESTLTAAMLDASCAEAVRSGLLVTALSATGVDQVDLGSALAVPEALGFSAAPTKPAPRPRPDLRVVPDPVSTEDAAAAEAAEAAAETARAQREAAERRKRLQAELRTAQKAYDRAERAVSRLEAKSLQLGSEVEELKGRLAEREAAHEELCDQLAEAEDVRDEAEAALDDARDAGDAADEDDD